MNIKNLTKTFKVTVLTPVHIGSGFRKTRGIDFYVDDRTRRTVVVDLDEIGEAVADKSAALNELASIDENHSIGDFIQKNQLRSQLKNLREFPLVVNAHDYLEFERNGLGVPFIPGSSLKGALRTVLLRNMIDHMNPQERERILRVNKNAKEDKASEDLLKRIFGNSSNDNLMRTIMPADVNFSDNDLTIFKSQVLSLSGAKGWHWKTTHSGNPMNVFCEGLKVNSTGFLTISIDQFLFNNQQAEKELKFRQRLNLDLEKLISAANAHAMSLLDKEIEFVEEHDNTGNLDNYLSTLSKLKRMIPPDNSGFLLKIGWGSGWKSMTGEYLNDYLDEQEMDDIRRAFGLGKITCPDGHTLFSAPKRGRHSPNKVYFCKICRREYEINEVDLFPVFPKSRKISFENSKPAFPFGWIKLEVQK